MNKNLKKKISAIAAGLILTMSTFATVTNVDALTKTFTKTKTFTTHLENSSAQINESERATFKKYYNNNYAIVNTEDNTKNNTEDEVTTISPEEHGFFNKDGYTYYKKWDGNLAKGWRDISGNRYYFDNNNRMVTGIKTIDNITRAFKNNGIYLGRGTKYISNASAYVGDTMSASGERPRWGTIATDPRVIPLGSNVYVPYFDKVFRANDTGGIIRGSMIDIFMTSYSQMNNFGRRNLEIVVLY